MQMSFKWLWIIYVSTLNDFDVIELYMNTELVKPSLHY